MPAATDRLHAVLQRFERPLLGYALVRCGDHGAAEDAVQETLLRFLRHDPPGDLEALAPWLFTTCRNVLTDHHRKSSRHPLMDDTMQQTLAHTTSPGLAPDEALVGKEAAHSLRQLMAALPDIQQEVVRLKFETGLAYRDIAAATGLSIANVGWLLHQAVTSLRTAWAEQESPGPVAFASC
jgi:RNA polymerase sigma factor (sigma-70 family)